MLVFPRVIGQPAGQRDHQLAAAIAMAVHPSRQNIARARRAITDCLAAHGVNLEEVWK